MFSRVIDFTPEVLQDLADGMLETLRRNPDPTYSINFLINRAATDLIVLSSNPKEVAILCEILIDDFGTKYLNVWGTYATIKFNFEEWFQAVAIEAKKAGCEYIEGISQRIGWAKVAKQYGAYIQPQIVFRKYI